MNQLKKQILDGYNIRWSTRNERSAFVAYFAQNNKIQSILNVGSGGERAISKHLNQNIKCTDIDFVGDVDFEINLDEVEKLPFKDKAFDLVCAMDVLEHLENFHLINSEIFRTSKKTVLISLPNSAAEIPYIFFNRIKPNISKERGFFSKYYGIPIIKQLDRHRYWMYPQDIIRFYQNFADKNKCSCNFIIPDLNWKRKLLKLILGERIYLTFFVSHVCIVLKK